MNLGYTVLFCSSVAWSVGFVLCVQGLSKILSSVCFWERERERDGELSISIPDHRSGFFLGAVGFLQVLGRFKRMVNSKSLIEAKKPSLEYKK